MSNRVAVVTGGAQGIGHGIALNLGSVGIRVAVADLNVENAEQTAKEIEAAGGKAVAVEMDIADGSSVRAGVRKIESTLGPIAVSYTHLTLPTN